VFGNGRISELTERELAIFRFWFGFGRISERGVRFWAWHKRGAEAGEKAGETARQRLARRAAVSAGPWA